MQEFKINHKQYKKEGALIRFSDESLEKIRLIISRYPQGKEKSALLPVLLMAQEELGGYLSVDVLDYVAGLLNLQPIEVYEVATFYTQFSLERRGKYLIEVCRTAPCALCGGEKISRYLRQKLNIKPGETTTDGLFTLREVECLGACGYAPAMQINTEFYENLTEDKVSEIIDELAKDKNDLKSERSRWAEKFF